MKELNKIKEILCKHINITQNEAHYFGSRARGSHRPNSDLDILITDNTPINPSDIAKLNEEFEESNIPFKIDIIIRSRISDEFYYKIQPDLIRISF
jgi:predicted nucleotidyltransferase